MKVINEKVKMWALVAMIPMIMMVGAFIATSVLDTTLEPGQSPFEIKLQEQWKK